MLDPIPGFVLFSSIVKVDPKCESLCTSWNWCGLAACCWCCKININLSGGFSNWLGFDFPPKKPFPTHPELNLNVELNCDACYMPVASRC